MTPRLKEKWLIKYSGICYGKRILLPEIIRNKVNEIYNCLFNCGGAIGYTATNDINENINDIINENVWHNHY